MSEEFEKCLRMLQVHNAKVDKIRDGYTNYCLMREQAVLEGVSIQEIRDKKMAEENGLDGVAAKKAKTARAGVAAKKGVASAKKKFAAKNKNDVEVMIKVKDEEGKIIEFENEDGVVAAPKKKKKVAKTVRAETSAAAGGPANIDAEDTLAMIKNALKSGAGNIAQELGDVADAGSDPAPKKKTVKKTTATKKKEPKMPKLEEN